MLPPPLLVLRPRGEVEHLGAAVVPALDLGVGDASLAGAPQVKRRRGNAIDRRCSRHRRRCSGDRQRAWQKRQPAKVDEASQGSLLDLRVEASS